MQNAECRMQNEACPYLHFAFCILHSETPMAQPVATSRQATRSRSGELSERALGLMMLAPMTLVLLLVVGYPLLDSFWLSLHRANLASPEQGQPFIGLGNYLYAF